MNRSNPNLTQIGSPVGQMFNSPCGEFSKTITFSFVKANFIPEEFKSVTLAQPFQPTSPPHL